MFRFIQLAIGVVPLVFPSVTLAQTAAPPIAAPTSDSPQSTQQHTSPNSPVEAPTPSAQSLEATPPSCPAGQFASKFPDVPPTEWAYEAVNRLAIGEFRCFPFSSQQ